MELVRAIFREHRTPPERQAEVFLLLWRRWAGSDFGSECMAEAERLAAMLQREAEVRRVLAEASPSAAVARGRKIGGLAPRHYVWLGDRRGVKLEVLKAGIAALADADIIATDREQQDALRRGLGVTVNDEERRHDAPWVLWRGPTDMLWMLVEGLWTMELITCAGGRQQKWRTATGVFLHADGQPFDITLKNSRCTNPSKIEIIRRAILNPLGLVH